MRTQSRRLALVTATYRTFEDRKGWLTHGFRRASIAGLALFALALLASNAGADSLAGSFFSVPGGNSPAPDFERGIDFSIVTGEVENKLGPDGLPVVSAYGASYNGPSGPITMVNSIGEILWWTPGVYGITAVGQANSTLPFNYPDMYVANVPDNFSNPNANDSSDYLTAVWRGSFVAPTSGTITITSGSDDDSYVFIDGTLVVDNGGIHGEATAPTTIQNLSAGTHTIDIFYADRHTVGAQLDFSATIQFNPATAVPEPGSLALLVIGAIGAGGFAAAARRRSRVR